MTNATITLKSDAHKAFMDAITNNRTIDAIRVIRDCLGYGLRDAKEIVDGYRDGVVTIIDGFKVDDTRPVTRLEFNKLRSDLESFKAMFNSR